MEEEMLTYLLESFGTKEFRIRDLQESAVNDLRRICKIATRNHIGIRSKLGTILSQCHAHTVLGNGGCRAELVVVEKAVVREPALYCFRLSPYQQQRGPSDPRC